jgi:hypothetical protein
MSAMHVRYCECGATREVPSNLRIASCTRCGRALALTSEAFARAPTTTLVAKATVVSQLLGAVTFALALAWIMKLGDRGTGMIAILALAAASVFVGGVAHRGSIAALACCGLLDLAAAIACFAHASVVHGFVYSPTAWLSPRIAAHPQLIVAIGGGAAALATVAVIAAVPEARRFAAWLNASADPSRHGAFYVMRDTRK